jgi:hypothetical protein
MTVPDALAPREMPPLLAVVESERAPADVMAVDVDSELSVETERLAKVDPPELSARAPAPLLTTVAEPVVLSVRLDVLRVFVPVNEIPLVPADRLVVPAVRTPAPVMPLELPVALRVKLVPELPLSVTAPLKVSVILETPVELAVSVEALVELTLVPPVPDDRVSVGVVSVLVVIDPAPPGVAVRVIEPLADMAEPRLIFPPVELREMFGAFMFAVLEIVLSDVTFT